ncbi:hypothetical protein A5662_25835 [Mycobacteriaceae bacterium 1482268.1]|nr:hypothetical protein A5662_25835 [Mycobacteriaceae bacterium 1482268.1]
MVDFGNFAGTINSLIWLLIVIVVIAVIVWAVRVAFAPRGGREYRERTVVQQPTPSQQPPPSGSLAPGWYPDQNDHRMMRYYDGRVWTSETRSA